MRNTITTIAAGAISALALAAAPAQAATPKAKPAAAAPAAKPAAPAAPGADAKVQNAVLYLKVLISALQSEKVEEPAKTALVGCIYGNSLSKISDSMDKVIAENAGKVSRDNPSQLLSVMVQICGYRPQQAPASAAPSAVPATPAPAPALAPTAPAAQPGQPTGR